MALFEPSVFTARPTILPMYMSVTPLEFTGTSIIKSDPSTLYTPNQEIVPDAKILDDGIAFVEGPDLIVDVPVNPRGVTYMYIGDIVGLAVNIEGSNNAM